MTGARSRSRPCITRAERRPRGLQLPGTLGGQGSRGCGAGQGGSLVPSKATLSPLGCPQPCPTSKQERETLKVPHTAVVKFKSEIMTMTRSPGLPLSRRAPGKAVLKAPVLQLFEEAVTSGLYVQISTYCVLGPEIRGLRGKVAGGDCSRGSGETSGAVEGIDRLALQVGEGDLLVISCVTSGQFLNLSESVSS